MPLAACDRVPEQELEHAREVVRRPLACLVRLSERELRPRRDAPEEPRVADLEHLLGARAEAPLRAVRQTDDERSALDTGKHPLEQGDGDAPETAEPCRGRRSQRALERAHGRSDPLPGSNGGLWWNGTPRRYSFSACQWISESTCSGITG